MTFAPGLTVYSAQMPPVPLEIVLSRMTPQELCEALAILRRCAGTTLLDRAEAERLTRRILERAGREPVEAQHS